jgi:hypothetical protein
MCEKIIKINPSIRKRKSLLGVSFDIMRDNMKYDFVMGNGEEDFWR